MVNGIIGFFKHLWDELVGHSIIPDMINGIINWFEQLPGRIVSSISRFISYITTNIGGLGAKALTWASDMISQFVTGIENGIGAVGNAVQKIASKIASFLHFSKPDVGPLVDVDKWMPDFGDLLAKGMSNQLSKVQVPALQLANTLSMSLKPSVNPSLAMPVGASAISNQISNNSSPTIVVQPPPIYLDGQMLTNGLLPHMTNAIRYGVGGLGI